MTDPKEVLAELEARSKKPICYMCTFKPGDFTWDGWKHVHEVHKPMVEREAVDHPSHYNSHPSGIECIEIVRHYNFNVGNAIKYLWRQGLKDGNSNIQDLKKAAWYIQDEINRLENIRQRSMAVEGDC